MFKADVLVPEWISRKFECYYVVPRICIKVSLLHYFNDSTATESMRWAMLACMSYAFRSRPLDQNSWVLLRVRTRYPTDLNLRFRSRYA